MTSIKLNSNQLGFGKNDCCCIIEAYKDIAAKVISGNRRIATSQTAHFRILTRPYAVIRHTIAKTPIGGMADIAMTMNWAIPAIR